MSSVHYQQAICPTAINSLNGYEPTFNSPGLWDGSQHVLSSNKEAAEHDGCFACRWRKKRCRHGQYGLPSPDSPCTDCKRFHILCFGAGQERPTGKGRADEVRGALKAWIGNKNNRKAPQPFDLAPFCDPTPTKFWKVDPNPPSRTTLVTQQTPPPVLSPPDTPPMSEYYDAAPLLSPFHLDDLLPTQVVENARERQAYDRSYSPVWGDSNSFTPPAAPYYGSEYLGSYTGSSGSSESPYLLNNATDPGNSTAKSSKKGKNAELEEDWANMFARLSIVAR